MSLNQKNMTRPFGHRDMVSLTFTDEEITFEYECKFPGYLFVGRRVFFSVKIDDICAINCRDSFLATLVLILITEKQYVFVSKDISNWDEFVAYLMGKFAGFDVDAFERAFTIPEISMYTYEEQVCWEKKEPPPLTKNLTSYE